MQSVLEIANRRLCLDAVAQVRGRALKKEEQEQVDIAQKVLEVLQAGKDIR